MSILIPVRDGCPYEMDDDDQPTFEQWMKRIDGLLLKYVGLSYMDLPDCRYADWYEDRLRPIHAANRVLRESMN